MRALLKTTTLDPYTVWTTRLPKTGQWKSNSDGINVWQRTNWYWGVESDLERGTSAHCGPRLPLTFSLCLVVVGAAVCVYYMYLSHIVYQVFISISFKLNIFRTSLVTMLWITLKHCGTFIVVWGCWLCAGDHVSRYTAFIMCICLLLSYLQKMTNAQISVQMCLH